MSTIEFEFESDSQGNCVRLLKLLINRVLLYGCGLTETKAELRAKLVMPQFDV